MEDAAKVDGQHYIVVTNPDGFSVGTRGYNLTYTVVPTSLAPGTGSGKNTTKDMTKPSLSMTTVWWIVGAVFFLWAVMTLIGATASEGSKIKGIFIFWRD